MVTPLLKWVVPVRTTETDVPTLTAHFTIPRSIATYIHSDTVRRQDLWLWICVFTAPSHLWRNSYPNRRMACSCTACSWTPVAGTMKTWWLRMRYLEWWTQCCQWCTLSHSGTTCLSPTSTTLLSTRPQPEPGLCPQLVQTADLHSHAGFHFFSTSMCIYNSWHIL